MVQLLVSIDIDNNIILVIIKTCPEILQLGPGSENEENRIFHPVSPPSDDILIYFII